jgi:flagellar hook assembly protein FlgD
VAGRLVRTLVNEPQESGIHEVTWDGRTDSGAASNAGVYFYRLEVGSWASQQKFVVLER